MDAGISSSEDTLVIQRAPTGHEPAATRLASTVVSLVSEAIRHRLFSSTATRLSQSIVPGFSNSGGAALSQATIPRHFPFGHIAL